MEGNVKKCFMCHQEVKTTRVLLSSRFVCEECLTVMTKNGVLCCFACGTALKDTPNNTKDVITCLCQDAKSFDHVGRPLLVGDLQDRLFNVPVQLMERNRLGERRYYSGKCYSSDPTLPRLIHSGIPTPISTSPKMKPWESNGKTTNPIGLCSEHDMEDTKFFCKTCKKRICRDCAILDHRDHDFVYYKEYSDTSENVHESLRKLLEYAEEKQIALNEKLENIDFCIEKKSKEIEEAKMKIRSRTLRMRELISEQENVLLSCLDDHIETVKKNVNRQKSALESALDDVNHGLEIAQEIFRKNSPATRKLPNGVTNSKGTSNQVNMSGHENSNTTGNMNGVAMETFNHEKSHLNKVSVSRFQSEIGFDDDIDDDDDNCMKIDKNEKKNKENASESNLPELNFDLELSKNAAFTMDDNQKSPLPKNPTFDFVMSFGGEGDTIGQFQEPVGLTVAPDGTIFVADYNNDRLQLFDKNGQFLRAVTHVTTETGRKVSFLCPTGLATDKSGNIVIAERGRHRITVITPEGKLQHKFGKLGKAYGQFRDPHGVAVDKRGRIIVADTTNNRIQVFDKDGDIIFAFGHKGDHVLDYPNYAIFHKGLFIVSDTDNDSVKIFDKDGHFLRTLGDSEREAEAFSAPSGLAFYRDEYIIVCDFNNDCLKIFTLGGEFVTRIGREGTGPGEFSGPEAVTVTSDEKIMVTDKNNSRVQVFELHKDLKHPN